MNWYVAKVIFRIISNEGNHQAQFDEQLRLISAESKCEAFEKAAKIGRDNENRFLNDAKQTVKWQFVNVAEVKQLAALTDGAELYYNIHKADNADLYMAWANHKAALIELNN
ncbi:DUF4288 domain-containing protein [Mucilaginibacter polytrichastri]|uniref:DUF4288 domain-containing protein n=1 Tax=Mucilaginibacter polytrichastri TaxID=1302689 RepID=A0A1Q5ZTC8_9SPHI|nr:DUF4288 domain-containing protein [Mucilaginibacter polytrichastri]OKS84993.1 hypothetical protein RG47T_0431 [Mucilaginibacter polytrichastri]SFS46434.1 protein of unknown function [Mucilaginibacter polytrichastri]